MDRDAGGTCYVLSGGMWGKADDSSVFSYDNSWYFADLDTDTIFSGTIPDKLTDENGKKLTEEDMTDGDVYLIYGDGIMLQSFPGQYPGITKMVRKEQGNQEKADHYRKELLSMMRPVTEE